MTVGEVVTTIVAIVGLVLGYGGLFWAREEVKAFREQNALMRADLQARNVEIPVSAPDSRPLPWRLYAPMIGSAICMVIIVTVAGYDIYDRHYAPEVPFTAQWNQQWDHAELKRVFGQNFANETVPLDGCEYIYCTFENVTFDYEGTAPSRLENNKLISPPNSAEGHLSVVSKNRIVNQTLLLMGTLFQIPGMQVQGFKERP
jgi:hypothetical protein